MRKKKCNFVLPAIYDECLSYYEVLCKLAKEISDIKGGSEQSVLERLNSLEVAVQSLQQIVEDKIAQFTQLVQEITSQINDIIGVNDVQNATLPHGDYDDFVVSYDDNDGIFVDGKLDMRTAKGGVQIPVEINVPLIAGNNIEIEENQQGDRIIINSSGGGGEPEEFIKSAQKSLDGNTLTLTDKDDNAIVFSPDTGAPESYIKTAEISDDGNTLTLTDENDSEVVFSPDGSTPESYIKTAEISDDGNTLTLTDENDDEIVFTPDSGTPEKYIKEIYQNPNNNYLYYKNQNDVVTEYNPSPDRYIYSAIVTPNNSLQLSYSGIEPIPSVTYTPSIPSLYRHTISFDGFTKFNLVLITTRVSTYGSQADIRNDLYNAISVKYEVIGGSTPSYSIYKNFYEYAINTNNQLVFEYEDGNNRVRTTFELATSISDNNPTKVL